MNDAYVYRYARYYATKFYKECFCGEMFLACSLVQIDVVKQIILK